MKQVEVPTRLYQLMSSIYSEFTGNEIAAAIIRIRQELNLVEEEAKLAKTLEATTTRLAEVRRQRQELPRE